MDSPSHNEGRYIESEGEVKCNHCEEQLEDITFKGNKEMWVSHKERVFLYVCTSRDCKNCGTVIAIPTKLKD